MLVAIDTSSFVAYLSGQSGNDIQQIDEALEIGGILMPPVVLTELLSDPKLSKKIIRFIKQIPLLEIIDGYWERAALLRASVLAKKKKSRLGDALIAQSCIDHNLPLITRDKDFRHYVGSHKLTLS